MEYGYSARIIELNKKADGSLLGVKVGRACIRKGIPVRTASKKFGVSHQTLYNWFCGVTNPQGQKKAAVAAILAALTN